MAAIGRGRSLKNLRIRGRNDSGEENVPLDLTRGLRLLKIGL
uniref:RPTOR independent companion of MTOR complex 2 n=1 Tax=Molossus molossus TaxID=27622 RepID=A0A7J8J3C6_MOLMO|nr:RPTOR independent companion of MTOR complex 2 [Molossus molossus]